MATHGGKKIYLLNNFYDFTGEGRGQIKQAIPAGWHKEQRNKKEGG